MMVNSKLLSLFVSFVIISNLIGCASDKKPAWIRFAEKQPNKWGHYSGYVEARWENDGRSMTLLSELRYTDPQGVVWIAPAGSQVDGASIPRSLWTLMGGPFEGKYRNASVLHDVAYEQRNRPPDVYDRMFYNAMRCSRVSGGSAAGDSGKSRRRQRHARLDPQFRSESATNRTARRSRTALI